MLWAGRTLSIAAVTPLAIWDATVAIPLYFLDAFFIATLDVARELSEGVALSYFCISRADILVRQGWGVPSSPSSSSLVLDHFLQRLVVML